MKSVQVPDDWCEDCSGSGRRALNGQAFTQTEVEEWTPEEREDYLLGNYDTKCDICNGAGRVDPEQVRVYYEDLALLKAEAPHMFQ